MNIMNIPPILYGTAWKEERTQPLVALALAAGFRGIDTANQRRHYFEAAVGDAIQSWIDAGAGRREGLFLQSKYTFARGQDHRLPYDPRAPIGEQVVQSFESTLRNLRTSILDSYLLHGPTTHTGWTEADQAAWSSMEALYDAGRVRALGVSNMAVDQLQALCAIARVPPTFVQNRCYANQGWDARVRAFCAQHGLTYQGFSLLTANREVLRHGELQSIARRHERTPAQIVLRFAIDQGMLPLTGTTSPDHMRDDLEILDFSLLSAEQTLIASLGLP